MTTVFFGIAAEKKLLKQFLCDSRIVAVHQLPKLRARVRFPPIANIPKSVWGGASKKHGFALSDDRVILVSCRHIATAEDGQAKNAGDVFHSAVLGYLVAPCNPCALFGKS